MVMVFNRIINIEDKIVIDVAEDDRMVNIETNVIETLQIINKSMQ